MALLNIFNISAAAFYLYLFIMVRTMRIKSREHTILSLTTLALFQWTITAYFVYNSSHYELVRWLLPVSCIGMFFFFPLNFHFAYSVCYRQVMPRTLFISIYSVGGVLSIVQFFHPLSMQVLQGTNGEIIVTQALDTPLNFVWMLYALTCWIVPMYFFFRYRISTHLNRQRKQATLLIRLILFTIILVLSEYYLTPHIPGWELGSQSPLLFSFWVGAMVFAIWKYGFLRISPGLLAEKILDSVEDLVVLYNMNGNAIYKNRKADSVLGSQKIGRSGDSHIKQKAVHPLLAESSSWSVDSPERQLTLKVPDGPLLNNHKNDRRFTVNFRVKPILDRFEDPLGVLVSGTVVPQFSTHLRAYQLSEREAEVLEYLMAGWTISQTAQALHITERTVKAHISNIYTKTGASNRIELSNMLVGARS